MGFARNPQKMWQRTGGRPPKGWAQAELTSGSRKAAEKAGKAAASALT